MIAVVDRPTLFERVKRILTPANIRARADAADARLVVIVHEREIAHANAEHAVRAAYREIAGRLDGGK